MKKNMNLFFRSIGYSLSLIYQSSGLLILLYLLFSIIGSTLALLGPFILKFLLDVLSQSNPQIDKAFIWITLYALLFVLQQANGAGQQIAFDTIFKKADYMYDYNLSKKLSQLPLAILDSSKGKDTIDDMKHIKGTAIYISYQIIQSISFFYTFIIAYIALIKFNVWISILFLVLIFPGIIMNKIFDKKAEILRLKKAPDVRKFSYYRWILTDTWPAKDVRMYDLTDSIKQRYDEEKEKYLSANKKLDKQKYTSFIFAELIRRSGEIAFIVFIVYSAINRQISIGDVTLYIGLAFTASNSFQSMVSILVMGYSRTTKVMERLFNFFSIKTEETRKDFIPLGDFESIEFKNVYFKYPYTKKYVLSGTSFSLKKGEKLSIVGINGSGKSTIIKLMMGLYEIDHGHILINKHPISDYNIQDVRKLFSILFQNFVQYPLTLRENIALSFNENLKDDKEIENALRQSDIYKDLKPQLEKGLDSYMTRQFDESGIELSKGQWQKIALARTYFKKAPIVIFDEPSSALDAEAEDKIFQNFNAISKNKTGIMISHRISSSRMSNKVIVLDSGKIIEEGTHEELLSLNGVYSKLYNLQRAKYTSNEEN